MGRQLPELLCVTPPLWPRLNLCRSTRSRNTHNLSLRLPPRVQPSPATAPSNRGPRRPSLLSRPLACCTKEERAWLSSLAADTKEERAWLSSLAAELTTPCSSPLPALSSNSIGGRSGSGAGFASDDRTK